MNTLCYKVFRPENNAGVKMNDMFFVKRQRQIAFSVKTDFFCVNRSCLLTKL